jgi:hypothetical protein
MKQEFRIIFTVTFDTAVERDKMYDVLKQTTVDTVAKAGIAKRGDMTKDDYWIQEPQTEKVI